MIRPCTLAGHPLSLGDNDPSFSCANVVGYFAPTATSSSFFLLHQFNYSCLDYEYFGCRSGRKCHDYIG